jgi:hypothetical protein
MIFDPGRRQATMKNLMKHMVVGSATGVLQSDGTLVGDLTSSTSGKLTWKAVRTVAR